MSVKDVIKKSVLSQFGDIPAETILLTLVITFAIGIYIFLIYYLYTSRNFYDKGLNITLVGMAVVTAAIVLALQSNLVISLGMVGALSIVRFRTAVKDPKDLLFLFWAISIGIICGAGMYVLAVALSLILSASIFLLELMPVGKANLLLLVNLKDLEREKEVLSCVTQFNRHFSVKTRNVSQDREVDMIIQLKTKEQNRLLEEIIGLDGVTGASLIAQNSDVNF